jgi:hypothetical protein
VPILVWSALPRGRETPYKRWRGLLPLTTAAAPQPPPDLAPPASVSSRAYGNCFVQVAIVLLRQAAN